MFTTLVRLFTLLAAIFASTSLYAAPHHHGKKAVSRKHHQHQQGGRTALWSNNFHFDSQLQDFSGLASTASRWPETAPQAVGHTRHLIDSERLADNSALQATREKIIARLKAQLGKPYVWGGESPREGFDCSGLVFYAYNPHLSSRLPRTANEMYHDKRGNPVEVADLRPGDLVFFRIHHGDRADHVGVYLGGGQFIQAPRTGETIRISDLDAPFWQQHWLGARRVISPRTIA